MVDIYKNSATVFTMNSSIISPVLTNPSAVATPKIGDVLMGTYGYEACIPTFVQVVGVSGKSVSVQAIDCRSEYKPNSGGMEWTVFPKKDCLVGPVVKKIFKAIGNGYKVKWTSYQNLYGPWTGTSVEAYNYH